MGRSEGAVWTFLLCTTFSWRGRPLVCPATSYWGLGLGRYSKLGPSPSLLLFPRGAPPPLQVGPLNINQPPKDILVQKKFCFFCCLNRLPLKPPIVQICPSLTPQPEVSFPLGLLPFSAFLNGCQVLRLACLFQLPLAVPEEKCFPDPCFHWSSAHLCRLAWKLEIDVMFALGFGNTTCLGFLHLGATFGDSS